MYIKSGSASQPKVYDLYYILRDNLGAITKLIKTRKATTSSVTATLEIAAEYTYDPYGKLLAVTNVNGDPIATYNQLIYKDYIYDSDTGWYYLQSRYYDPEIGRFINGDGEIADVGESVQGYNLFVYCHNDPVNMTDEAGNWPKWLTKVLIGTAVIATAAIVTVATGGAAVGTLAAAVHCVAAGALQGAIVGAAVGTVAGATTAVVKNRVKTGSWKGSAKAAIEGGADGFMTGSITGAITGGMNSNVCFVMGTAVLTSTGHVAIENIHVGDKVWSENPETGEKELKEVVQTFVNETDELVHVFANGEEIVTTPEHPFYVPTKGWIGAIHLRAGDILVLQNGNYVVLERIQHEILETPIKVYNFEVADFHTYYVGKDSILVHNVCGVRNTPDQDAVIQLAKDYKKGISMNDAKTLVEWAKEYNLSGNPRIDMGHIGRGIMSQSPHAHIGLVNHIPIF